MRGNASGNAPVHLSVSKRHADAVLLPVRAAVRQIANGLNFEGDLVEA